MKIVVVKVALNTYVITNSGPPVFTSSLETVNVKVGNTVTYSLPSQRDPDEGDKISIQVFLKQAIVFSSFDAASKQFTFSPQIGMKYSAQYEIFIVLADNNINPQKNEFKLTVQVEKFLVNNQIKNQTDDEILDAILNSKDKVAHRCGIKIVQVSRNGQMQLRITSSSYSYAAAIASELKDSHIQVYVAEKPHIIAKIEDVLDGNILSIQLEFISSEQISIGMVRMLIIKIIQELDYLQAKILKSIILEIGTGYAYLLKGTTAAAPIPIQYSSSQQRIVSLLESSEDNTQIVVLTFSIVLQLFFGFAMNLIWGMMNDLSFIISLGMISIPIPGIASPIQSLLSTIIYMDVLMTDKWLSNFLEDITQISEEDDDAPMNLFVGSQGFQSKLLLFNLGSTLIFFRIQVVLLLYTILMRLLSSFCLRAKKQYAFFEKKLIWGGTIRFIIQQFQPLIFSSLINIKTTSLSDLQVSSIGVRFNFYLSTAIFAGTLISIAVFFVIVKQGKAGDNRYSTLIEGLNSNQNNFAAYWTVWTLAKWSLMCFVLILLADYPGQQLQLLVVLSMLSTTIQLASNPMDPFAENLICLFNEIMATIYLYTLIGLAIASDNIVSRENIGIALISILLLSLLINILKVLIMIVIEVVKKIKEKLNSSDNRVQIIQKSVQKYPSSMPSIPEARELDLEEDKEEKKEEMKEEIIDQQQLQQHLGSTMRKKKGRFKKKKIQSRRLLLNETNFPQQQSISRSICVQEIPEQDFSLFKID
ncbi:hypothetical protein FGO68_gene15456 [Halteria grandinella]|uniref:TRP C-terminal domain-containing protein n=1 Tax=Halteria grandinella TaxID=5974 RepID=A0A8J8P645_HALGN|nr:hypothetical protein FGO68_gene15456 [Halteria grandinella]